MKKVLSFMLAVVIFTGMLAGCNQTASSQAGRNSSNTTESTVNVAQKEAPLLAEQVKAGKLPAVEKRLPIATDIMVEPDVVSVGEYGGSITMTSNDNGRWDWGPYTEQSMFRFKQDGSGQVEANVCKNFSVNADATVWTIELREGMKWSDGQSFTADDVIFYYDHMSTPALNPDRTAVAVNAAGYYPAYTTKPYNCYQVSKDGKKYWAKFDKVNDYKFTVTFAAPKPSFPSDVAVDNKLMFIPKHFYINYVARKDGVKDDASFPLITEEQALANANKAFGKQWDSYGTMGQAIGYYNWDYAIIPQIRSFIAVKDNWNTVGETYELVRNPYFFKTDSQGRQLPYLDSIKFEIINEKQQVVLKAASGEFDVSKFEIADYSTVAAETKNTHTTVNWLTPDWSTTHALALCQTVKDLDKRALFQDIRFRQALSISVDRNLLNATLMNGQSQPVQSSIKQGMAGYNAEWEKKWTEYDVNKANSLLDEITEPWDKAVGTYRKIKGTDKELEIVISISDPSTEGDFLTLLQTAYKAIGIKISNKVDADIAKSVLANNVEASFKKIGVSTPAIRPDTLVPMRNLLCWYGAYGKWYEDGKSEANGGIKPTGDMLELINAYDAMQSATGPTRDKVVSENVQKIYDLHQKNVWVIGFLKMPPIYWVINNKVKNFPKDLIWVDEFRLASMMRPEQLYLAK